MNNFFLFGHHGGRNIRSAPVQFDASGTGAFACSAGFATGQKDQVDLASLNLL